MDTDLTIKFAQPGSTIDVPSGYGNVDMVRVERTLDWLKNHHTFWDQDAYLAEGDKFYYLLQRIGEDLIKIPANFDLQETDNGENECGTTFCFAGAALMVHDRIAIRDDGTDFGRYVYTSPLMANGSFTPDYARAARQLLGLTENQADMIFNLIPDNDEHDIDVFIQFVREVVADKLGIVSRDRYYELLYEKHPELLDLD